MSGLKSREGKWQLAYGLILFLTLLQADGAPPEYLAAEQSAPSVSSDLLTPLDGFSDEVKRFHEGNLPARRDSRFSFLDNAVFELSPRSYYFYSTIDGKTIYDEWSAGGGLGVTSGWWRDSIRVRISGYTSQSLYGPAGREGSGILTRDGGGYWTPGEAYLEGRTKNKVSWKAFRQELTLPYLNRNDTRMTPKVHEGYFVTSDAIPRLRIGVGHITKVKARNSSDFESLSEAAGAVGTNAGGTLAGARYQWNDEKSSIGILNNYGWNTFNTLYLESTYNWELSHGFDLNTSSQYSSQESTGREYLGDFDTDSLGLQAALSFRSLVATLGWTSVGDGERIRSPWGGSPGFNSVMISDFERAGQKSWRTGLSYQFSRLGLPGVSAFTNYVQGDSDTYEEEEFNFTLDVKPEAPGFKNVWLRIRSGWNEGDGVRREDFRVILNYSAEF